MKHIPLILLVMFLAGLAALVFAIEIDFRNRPCSCENKDTIIVRNGVIFEIVGKY